jgi:nucleoside-diphosphate-sugar epimerase
MGNTLLVVGATGIVGSAALHHFSNLAQWEIVALSRRPIAPMNNVRHVQADLIDLSQCQKALADEKNITHVLYTALYEKPDLVAGWSDRSQMDMNHTMLKNLLDALEPVALNLKHISLMQGTKAYGLHAKQVPVPAKEKWPRATHDVFYWPQEDLLRQRQSKASWFFSILRPQLILGASIGSPMNILAAIGVYAAVMRELGKPLCFPGGGRYVHAASDSRLIVQAAQFVGTQECARNETFNVVNGDMLVWQDVWPAIAKHFDMPMGEAQPMQLSKEMPLYEDVWQRVVKKYQLKDMTMASFVNSSWQFTDRSFGFGLDQPLDRIVSPIKLRKVGFAACEDTEESMLYGLTQMQEARWLPK